MRAQAYTRYIPSRLHRLAFPELWKFEKTSMKYKVYDDLQLKIYTLKLVLEREKVSASGELLDAIAKMSSGGPFFRENFRHIFEQIHPNILYESIGTIGSSTLLCRALRKQDSKVLEHIFSDPRTDFNLVGCLPHHAYREYTALEVLLYEILRNSHNKSRIKFALEWIPKLIAKGAVMCIDAELKSSSKLTQTVLSEFIEVCATHESLKCNQIEYDEFYDSDPYQSSDEETDQE